MLSDWYRVLEIGMGLGEWERLPRHAGFRYEYVGGRAVIVPRAVQRDAVLDLGRVVEGAVLEGVRVMEEGDWGKLPRR